MKTDLQWQPIETAPRDGRIVLVNDTNEGLSPWAFASYLDSDDWAGWIYDDPTAQDSNPLGPQPTHWIPLPPLPSYKGNDDENRLEAT